MSDPSVSTSEPDFSQLPPPRFETLVQLLATQAMVALGAIPADNGQPVKQLPLARHFIDLLGVLEAKTKGHLDQSEQRMLDQALHELRILFVTMSRQ